MPSRLTLPAVLGLNLVLFAACLALTGPAKSSPRRRPAGPARLELHWHRDLGVIEPAWPDQPRFTSDGARRPVVAGELVLLSCPRTDSLLALAADTGEVRWRFTADGPVRFAPAVWGDFAYVASDDGSLYCLNLSDGSVQWSARGGPGERRVLGNGRLVSTWPARGGPVVAAEDKENATVYFAAGIWPFMGIFIHALDAKTGAARWTNSGDGSTFIKQPHNADAFAGVAPQGSLVVDRDRLFVAGGRSVPACYDRHTGKLLHFRLAENSKRGGGPDVLAGGGVYVNGGAAFAQQKGEYLGVVAEPVDMRGTALYSVSGKTCRAFDLAARPGLAQAERDEGVVTKVKNKVKQVLQSEAWLGEVYGEAVVPRSTALLAAGKRLYGAGPGKVYVVPLPLARAGTPTSAEAPVSGTPVHLAAGGERLFVSTREGGLYAFGTAKVKPRSHRRTAEPMRAAKAEVERANQIVKSAGVRDGYALLCGVSPGVVGELLRTTKADYIVVEPDAAKAGELRKQLIAAGIDFRRCAVVPRSLAEARLPPYLCERIVIESGDVSADDLAVVFRTLRPYGGTACLSLTKEQGAALNRWAKTEPTARLRSEGNRTLLVREGALPGAGDWTHEHADAANTRVSRDKLVKAPMGVLWFGGTSHQGILPRHGHGPVPQAVDGRLMIEGTDLLRAIDVYTGRQLWEARLPGLGQIYDNTAHQAGANAAGSNYVCTSAGIYVAHQRRCVRLDPATGKEIGKYELPPLKGEKTPATWAFVAVEGPYLIAGAVTANKPRDRKTKQPLETIARLSVLDRKTGRLLWSADAAQGWRHNAVCAGGGRLYAIDRTPSTLTTKPKDKKDKTDATGQLLCFDLASGKRLWASDDEVFGTWLSYSAKHDVLVEAGLMTRDTLFDEAAGLRAYSAAKGDVLWYEKGYYGPALIHGDHVLKGGDSHGGSGTACDVRTGKPVMTTDPLTGEPREWRWARTYGCNTPAACENLVLFRSGAAGFYDLEHDGGTGNFGGFRSSCTMNLIAAGGVLTIPDYTRSCTCSYQQQTSVGLVHMPEAEVWTFTAAKAPAGVVRRVGLNLGGPGSRKEKETLWVEYPPAGGPSPRLAITTQPAQPQTFRTHEALVKGKPAFVAGSGVRGLRELVVRLGPDGSAVRKYTVRLVFLEPDGMGEGKRVFDVALQGEKKIDNLDVSKEAGGAGRALVREFTGVRVGAHLRITLTPEEDLAEAVLSGVEVIAEGW